MTRHADKMAAYRSALADPTSSSTERSDPITMVKHVAGFVLLLAALVAIGGLVAAVLLNAAGDLNGGFTALVGLAAVGMGSIMLLLARWAQAWAHHARS